MMHFVEVAQDATMEAKQKIADLLQSLGVSPGPYVPVSPMGAGKAAMWFDVADEDVDAVIGGLNGAGHAVLNVADVRGAGQSQGNGAPLPAGQGPAPSSAPRPAGAAPSGPPPARPPVPSASLAHLLHMIPPPVPGGGRVRNTPMPPPAPVETVVETAEADVEAPAPVVAAPAPVAAAPVVVEPEASEESTAPEAPPEVHEVLLPPSRWLLKDADDIHRELDYVRSLDNDDLHASQHGTSARIRLGAHLGTARWQQTDGTYSLTVHPDMAASDAGEFIGDGYSWLEMLEALQAYALDAVGIFNNRVARSRETAEKRKRKKTPEPAEPTAEV